MKVVIQTDHLSKYYGKGGEIKAVDELDLARVGNGVSQMGGQLKIKATSPNGTAGVIDHG